KILLNLSAESATFAFSGSGSERFTVIFFNSSFESISSAFFLLIVNRSVTKAPFFCERAGAKVLPCCLEATALIASDLAAGNDAIKAVASNGQEQKYYPAV